MLQIGIRLHDVNGKEPAELQTLEARAAKAKEEGFSCVHLALSKVIKGVTWDAAALTEGVSARIRRVFGEQGLDVAVLGCYLNLANPDPEKLKELNDMEITDLHHEKLRVPIMDGLALSAADVKMLEPFIEFYEEGEG